MMDNMKESFLITKSWDKVRVRIKRDKGLKEADPLETVK
jgi:hypothetical protein